MATWCGRLAVVAAAASGCASTHAASEAIPSRPYAFLAPTPARQIEETLAAKPTLPAAAKVAYFVSDPSFAPEIDAILSSSPRVIATHRIPAVLVPGRCDVGEPGPARGARALRSAAGRLE